MKNYVADLDVPRFVLSWNGACFQIWMYHVSLKRLVLRLYRPDDPQSLYIVCAGCESISCKTTLDRVKLRFDYLDDGSAVFICEEYLGVIAICATVSAFVSDDLEFGMFGRNP